MYLTPAQIVAELDKHIVGQRDAKRAVALALRNRYRRMTLSPEDREEVTPKNILLIGPTGVGKTEIARRLARLADAPFLKVEATKYTEVGYVGRDVESMIRDLAEVGMRMVRESKREAVMEKAEESAERALLECLLPRPASGASPFSMLFGQTDKPREQPPEQNELRELMWQKLRRRELEESFVEVEVNERSAGSPFGFLAGSGMEEVGVGLQEMMGSILPRKTNRQRLTVADARKILLQEEVEKLLDAEALPQSAVELVEQNGIVFIDELDKVAGKSSAQGPDVSREGVQRDILPIVEGSTVSTKYGPVRTDHVLFIAAGAFHISKPSDLIPELQGRFPVRAELNSLSESDLRRILLEPKASLVSQYQSLFRAEGVRLEFTDAALDEIARAAHSINTQGEDIGARRLQTVMEKVLEEYSFVAGSPEANGSTREHFVVTDVYVRERLAPLMNNSDLSKFIL